MLMRQFICFLYNKIVAALLANHTRNCMIIIAICGSFAELFAKVLNYIENLSVCSVKSVKQVKSTQNPIILACLTNILVRNA